jgi:hypothetical protein
MEPADLQSTNVNAQTSQEKAANAQYIKLKICKQQLMLRTITKKYSTKGKQLLLTLQTPQATVHSSLVADAWFAWHSMQRSMM